MTFIFFEGGGAVPGRVSQCSTDQAGLELKRENSVHHCRLDICDKSLSAVLEDNGFSMSSGQDQENKATSNIGLENKSLLNDPSCMATTLGTRCKE